LHYFRSKIGLSHWYSIHLFIINNFTWLWGESLLLIQKEQHKPLEKFTTILRVIYQKKNKRNNFHPTDVRRIYLHEYIIQFLRVEKLVTTMTFPTQWLVIGVPVTLEKETLHCSTRWDRYWVDSVIPRQGWNLHCHAWMTLVALVVASRRHWS